MKRMATNRLIPALSVALLLLSAPLALPGRAAEPLVVTSPACSFVSPDGGRTWARVADAGPAAESRPGSSEEYWCMTEFAFADAAMVTSFGDVDRDGLSEM